MAALFVTAARPEYLNGPTAIVWRVAHGRLRSADQLNTDFARSVADTMQALATPSRVRILGRLRGGAASVNELAKAVGMEPSAVSHQLRLLRHLGFVVGRRDGRHVVYDLYDDHVAHLLDEAVAHVEHVQLGLSGRADDRVKAVVTS
jgi:DNA-binding transcriptional ArsR family regulator